MVLSNPIWIWALAGLLIPVAIHFLSRREGRIIEMGSIRFLRQTATAKFRHIKLNEAALLLLRCFLVLLLVFLLTGLQTGDMAEKRKWVVLDEGIQGSEKIKPFLDTLRKQGFDIRLMASGFPPLSKSGAPRFFTDYWTAASALATASVDTIVVISYNYQRKFKGPRIAMPAHIKWISHDVNEKEYVAGKIRMGKDSVWVRKGYTSSSFTYFETEKNSALLHRDSMRLSDSRELNVLIIKDDNFDFDHQVLLASLKAIQTVTPHRLKILTRKPHEWSQPFSPALIFWLAEGVPATPPGSTVVAMTACKSQDLPLLMPAREAAQHCEVAGTETWVFTRRLDEDIALKEHLAIELGRLILPSTTRAIDDHRTLPERMMWSSASPDRSAGVRGKTGNKTERVLILLLVVTLMAERLLAHKRNQ